MPFRFSANLSLEEAFDPKFMLGRLSATTAAYPIAVSVALGRGVPLNEAATEAQCAVIGNIGFLGIPVLALQMGEAVGFIMMMLAVELLAFGSLVVILITGGRDGRMSFRARNLRPRPDHRPDAAGDFPGLRLVHSGLAGLGAG